MIEKLIQKIRFISFSRKEPYFSLHKLLGFRPKNIAYYQLSLLHRSSGKRTINGVLIDNERLEFLGDAILSAIISDFVYQKFPLKKEGFLTDLRSKIVQRDYLDQLAQSIGLDKLLYAHNRNLPTQQAIHIYGNALEALIGAIYLDQGYDQCQQFIAKQIIDKHTDINQMVKKEYNFKSKLIEWAQKRKLSIIFVVTNTEVNKEKNTIVFHSIVLIENIEMGTGCGYSKKESQQNAARNALHQVKNKETISLLQDKQEETNTNLSAPSMIVDTKQ